MSTEIPKKVRAAEDAYLAVGGGRGSLLAIGRQTFILTAAHCLPHLPPAHPAMHLSEKTYGRLIGQLSSKVRQRIACECLFVDPISDIAVICEPDSQTFSEESDKFEALVEGRRTLRIVRFTGSCRCWARSLDGTWSSGTASRWGRSQFLSLSMETRKAVAPGTSGSPVLNDSGCVIGIVSTSEMNPIVFETLPPWIVRPRKH